MTTHHERAKAIVRGAVQGVGFRPFVYRLAKELDLVGWVLNSAQGVFIEVEGAGAALREFLVRLEREKPPRAIIQSLEFSFLDAVGYKGFEIRTTEERGAKTVLILPDIATCPQCLAEIFQSGNRRHRYPFTNCTNCGPRFTIIEELPYDRVSTSMKKFKMCPECENEYHDPVDRRFHAQPNGCARCGPHLELWDAGGNVLARHDEALHRAAEEVRAGKIVALKGLGGFQLIADARNESAVKLLRQRKRRSEKPFALMYPSLDMVREHCHVSELEERLLLSAEAPIVLLHTTGAKSGAERVTPVMGRLEGDRVYVFASKAGAPTNPDWFHNLVAQPSVTVELGTEVFGARAVVVDREERDRVYTAQAADFANFAEYEKATDRVIPVVRLERT